MSHVTQAFKVQHRMYILFPGYSETVPLRSCHTVGQSQQEANQAVLPKGEYKVSQGQGHQRGAHNFGTDNHRPLGWEGFSS